MSKTFQRLTQRSDVSDEGTKIAMEMIEFQNDDFARSLEVLFAEVLKAKSSARKEIIKDIVDLTYKRTGLKMKFITNSAIAAVIPFYVNESHIFLEKMWHGHVDIREQRKILAKAFEQKGTVDLKKCKVTGVFSEYEIPMYMNFDQFNTYKMTPGEVTAVYLHETGHAFTACEYANRMNTTNQVLQNLLDKALQKSTGSKDYIYKELKQINSKTTDEELEKIFGGQNTIFGRETFKFLQDTVETQLGQARYDENAFETLADNFAARWHYGKQLVTALQKLQPAGIFDTTNSFIGNAISSLFALFAIAMMVKLVFLLITTLSTAAAIGGFIGAAGHSLQILWFGFILFMSILGHSTYMRTMTYDDLIYRYKRIRNQYVELLKDADLDSEQIKSSIEAVKALDLIINARGDYKNLVTIIVDFLTPGTGKIDDNVRLQRILEDLSANPLYIKAAALRAS